MKNGAPRSDLKRNGRNGQPHRASERSRQSGDRRPVLITGGAGFIGTNLAHRFLSSGQRVVLYDNLSRAGVAQNVAWLQSVYGDMVQLEQADIRDFERLSKVVEKAGQVYHFAAQVAVTTSLNSPFEDFEINARGTLNLLEALRRLPEPPPLLFTSTNKVYGDLAEVKFAIHNGRYEPVDPAIRNYGFSEASALHFHSPYGCSKGAACQYVLDYARTFHLPTVVFRMSCIYGPHQFGTEDQGWVAHFLIQALEDRPITIYGNGRQVRDVLFVDDLVDALVLAQQNIHKTRGRAFNLGGGPRNTISLLELIDCVTRLHGSRPEVLFEDWRPADQQYYVSDIRRFRAETGWEPQVDVHAGIAKLYHWLQEFRRPATDAIALPSQKNGRLTHPNGNAFKSVRQKKPLKPKSIRSSVEEASATSAK